MNTMGNALRLTLFGSSHGPCIGCVLDGVPSGTPIDVGQMREDLSLRRPRGDLGTPRREADEARVVSGVMDDVTTGAPLTIVIDNGDVDSSPYDVFRRTPRPGHADLCALTKYANHDIRGGGQFSGRMTAPLVAAGSVARTMLRHEGVEVAACTLSVGDVVCAYPTLRDVLDARGTATRAPPTYDGAVGECIRAAGSEGDSVGGRVRCVAVGLPIGLGEPFFDTLDGELAKAMFSIPAVKAVEFGDGFRLSGMRGSDANDPFVVSDDGVCTEGNRCGGVLGGMSDGMPLEFTVGIKPTPSIGRPQRTVDLERMVDAELRIAGRHDPCIVPRAVAVVEAMTMLTVADLMIRGGRLG